MATTQITDAAYQDACAECGDAITAGDFPTAWRRYALAETIHAGLSSTDEKSREGYSLKRREDLSGLRGALEALDSGNATSRAPDRKRAIYTKTSFAR